MAASSLPNILTVPSTSARTSSSMATSARMYSALPPSSRSSAASASPSSSRRPESTTDAPSRAKAVAVARPIPARAPVTSTTCSLIISFSHSRTERLRTSSGARSDGFGAVFGEGVAEHGQPAHRRLAGHFVFDDVPVLDELAVAYPHGVHHDPRCRLSVPGETAAQHHHVPLGHDQLELVAQCLGQGLDQAEQTVSTRWDVRAVLDVVRRPIGFRACVVAPVEQCVERFKDTLFVLSGRGHGGSDQGGRRGMGRCQGVVLTGSRTRTGISRPALARYSGKCGHRDSASFQASAFSSPNTSRARRECTWAPSCSRTSGWAIKLKYQAGCFGAPPAEATARYLPSCSIRMTGVFRILPLAAPVMVRMTTGRPSRVPPSRPSVAS